MAGALVGGAFLSAFLQVAFDRLASRDFRDFLKGRNDIDGSLKKLKTLLRSATMVLADAEEKQYTNPYVKEWLDDLQGAVYDADDLLDEIAFRCKLQAESQTGAILKCKTNNFEPLNHTDQAWRGTYSGFLFGIGGGQEDVMSPPEDRLLHLVLLFFLT